MREMGHGGENSFSQGMDKLHQQTEGTECVRGFYSVFFYSTLRVQYMRLDKNGVTAMRCGSLVEVHIDVEWAVEVGEHGVLGVFL